MTDESGTTGSPWTRSEVEAIVAVYFQMLRMQELGQKQNRTEVNRRLQSKLPARSIGSIEYKHRNISAVLNHYGVQTLSGYKPLHNFQRLLFDVVGEALQKDRTLDEAALRRVEAPAETPVLEHFHDFVVNPPTPKAAIEDSLAISAETSFIKKDYLEREARNRSLGLAGELLVLEYEARRLFDAGARNLVDRIEHVSQTLGDGAGFDILSFEENGRERLIEVKTTAYEAETPFFVTRNEVRVSNDRCDQFQLYRLFHFRDYPRMFTLRGGIDKNCKLQATTFRATLRTNSP